VSFFYKGGKEWFENATHAHIFSAQKEKVDLQKKGLSPKFIAIFNLI
jgi:hypothetical protein